MNRVLIFDGYVDEPTCLGVPPYISPYPRYIYGAIKSADPSMIIDYVTIDQIRNMEKSYEFLKKFDVIIIIAGMVVPGRYLAGYPISPREIVDIFSRIHGSIKILSGPAARFGFGLSGGKATIKPIEINEIFDLIIPGDPDLIVNHLIHHNFNIDTIDPSHCHQTLENLNIYAIAGSDIVTHHPYYPDYLITEIETYRGCSRSVVGGCSFCSEPIKGTPRFREINDIVKEVERLYQNGIRHFRLGNQPCFFSYKAIDAENTEFPQPNPEAIEELLKKIRKVTPDLKTLHIDNANPGILARYPKQCYAIAKSIIKYHTSGDVAAFGVESVDPIVIEKNNLKANPDEVLKAIKLLNEVGATRGSTGLPELLPGLNFVMGLPGETKKTYSIALDFLRQILDANLLIRRINIRQVLPIPGSKLDEGVIRISGKHKAMFQHFKNQVRNNIEQPLLRKLIPKKILLRDIYTECYNGNVTFGRQLGSYPLLVGIPGRIDLHKFIDAKLIDYGFRSITAIPYPLNINTAPVETIEALPGIGKKRALRIINSRPISNYDELANSLDDQLLINELRTFLGNEIIS